MNAHGRPEVPEEGRADLSELADAPFSVVCDVADLDMARRLIEDLEEHDVPRAVLAMGLVMGAVFGAGVGLAAGGMSIAKYSSPAWDEIHEVEKTDDLHVGLHHASVDVIDTAGMVTGRHTSGRINRMGWHWREAMI